MTWPNPPRCDLGEHDWKIAHDYIGDSDVAYGTQRITFRVCRACGIEDHEHDILPDFVNVREDPDVTRKDIDRDEDKHDHPDDL